MFLQVAALLVLGMQAAFGVSITDRLEFVMFYGSSIDLSVTVPFSDSLDIFKCNEFCPEHKTVLWIGGITARKPQDYLGMPERISLTRNTNLIAFDHSGLNPPSMLTDYFTDVFLPQMEIATILLADQIISWFDQGLPVENLHMVSHSVGCQISGSVARNVRTRSFGRYRIQRLTELDPNRAMIYPEYGVTGWSCLETSDAVFIDAYHTNYNERVAHSFPVGTVNIWVNGPDDFQPGCCLDIYNLYERVFCSHTRALFLWNESLRTDTPPFYAGKARDYEAFKNGNITDVIVVGAHLKPGASGNYFLHTNGESPYSRGKCGLICVP